MTESYDQWKAGIQKLERPPLTRWRLEEIYKASSKHGTEGRWKGAAGRLAGMIRELLADRERLFLAPPGDPPATTQSSPIDPAS